MLAQFSAAPLLYLELVSVGSIFVVYSGNNRFDVDGNYVVASGNIIHSIRVTTDHRSPSFSYSHNS